MQGRSTLQETLAAIAAQEYQRAGAVALGGVATPMRVLGEALAALVEAFAEPGAGGTEWRDRVVIALDAAVPSLLDGMQALYANVLFERLLRPNAAPLFKLDVPGPQDVVARAQALIAEHGAAQVTLLQTHEVFAGCTHLLKTVLRVADTWASCAAAPEKLEDFYPLADEAAQELMTRATTLRIASTIFASG